jgi:hypothetical protein
LPDFDNVAGQFALTAQDVSPEMALVMKFTFYRVPTDFSSSFAITWKTSISGNLPDGVTPYGAGKSSRPLYRTQKRNLSSKKSKNSQ